MVRGFPFEVPKEYANLPQLKVGSPNKHQPHTFGIGGQEYRAKELTRAVSDIQGISGRCWAKAD